MDEKTRISWRRKLLDLEVKSRGLAVTARATGKPDRQIKDMIAGRKSFGDKIAREIGPLLRKDLSADWLVNPCDPETHKPFLSLAECGLGKPENSVQEPASNYHAGLVLTSEEHELLEGFRVAHPDVQQTMVDMARRATKTAEEKINHETANRAVVQ